MSLKERWSSMTNEQLCVEYQKSKSDELYEYFLKRNEGLIFLYIKPLIIKKSDDREQLYQRGRVAMWNTMSNFDISKNTKFSTLFYYYMKDELWENMIEKPIVRLPEYVYPKMKEMIEKYPDAIYSLDSLNRPLTNDYNNPYSVEHTVCSEFNLEEMMIEKGDNEFLLESIDRLGAKGKMLVYLYYGLSGEKPHTLRELGEMFNVTHEAIRQQLVKLINKLQGFMARYYGVKPSKVKNLIFSKRRMKMDKTKKEGQNGG